MAWREKDGCAKYAKSNKVAVDRAISWAWNTITKKAKSPLAFVPYSQNGQQQSRWGGMDFDAHPSEVSTPAEAERVADRARELAFSAFRLLLNAPDLAVILETSGSGGWHVWAISPDFHPIGEWVRLLKFIANAIGTTITSGVCEIFPANDDPVKFGKGMRAPGSWNPRTDKYNEIVWENTHTSLGLVLSGKSKNGPLNSNDLQCHFPDKEKSISFSLPYHATEFLSKLGITAASTRNSKLCELVGECFHQVGHTVARSLAELQFRGKCVATNASEAEHMASFEKLWQGLSERWNGTLSEAERDIFARLETENERDAFRIVRSFSGKAADDGAADFPIVRDNLGKRLGITGKGAAWIRDKLAKFGAIEKTANYVANKSATRFRWILNDTGASGGNPF